MTNQTVKISSTSKKSASVTPILLRGNEVTRLIFRPQLVDNVHDKDACVKGTLVFQRKKTSGKWEDLNEQKLSELKAGEGFALTLHSAELKTLHQYIGELFRAHKELGGIVHSAEFELTPKGVADALKQITDPENLHLVLEKLQQLDINSMEKLNTLVGVTSLKKILDIWEQNKTNGTESFWQDIFKENTWILSQIFAHPVVILQEQAYVGGKGLSNSGGNVVDFIYRNELAKSVAMIEVKTPQTKLMQDTRYRNNVNPASTELAGVIGQVLNYKYELQKNSPDAGEEYHAFDPKCIVVIGNTETENMDAVKRKSFELFRNQLKDVEIVTFDELFQKVKNLMNLLETGTWEIPEPELEEIPTINLDDDDDVKIEDVPF